MFSQKFYYACNEHKEAYIFRKHYKRLPQHNAMKISNIVSLETVSVQVSANFFRPSNISQTLHSESDFSKIPDTLFQNKS
jgi:hypothetical protein